MAACGAWGEANAPRDPFRRYRYQIMQNCAVPASERENRVIDNDQEGSWR